MKGYDLNKVCQVRDELYNKSFAGLVGLTADKDIIKIFANRAAAVLPGDCSLKTIYLSLEHLAGLVLTTELAYENCWRLAGNWQTLSLGKVCKPWRRQAAKEWVSIQITDYAYLLSGLRNFKDGSRTFYHVFKLRIMSGSSCPMFIFKGWSSAAMPMLARQLGFTSPWGKHPYRMPRELVNMRFLGCIDQEFCRDDKPGFRELKATATHQKWNRALLKMRERIPYLEGQDNKDSFECMEGFDRVSVPCHKCFRGYTSCPAATHPFDFIEEDCIVCKQRGWIDTSNEKNICINCSMENKK